MRQILLLGLAALLLLSCDSDSDGILPEDSSLILGRMESMMNDQLWDYDMFENIVAAGEERAAIFEFRHTQDWVEFWTRYRQTASWARPDTVQLPQFPENQILIGLFRLNPHVPFDHGDQFDSAMERGNEFVLHVPFVEPPTIAMTMVLLSIDLVLIPKTNGQIRYEGDVPALRQFP